MATASPASSEVSERLSAIHQYSSAAHQFGAEILRSTPPLSLSNAQAQVNPCASHVCWNVTSSPPCWQHLPHLAAHRYQCTALVPGLSWGAQSPKTVDCPVWPARPRRTHFCKHFAAQLANPQRRGQGSQDNCVSETGAAACASSSMTILCSSSACCCSSAVHVGWQWPRQHICSAISAISAHPCCTSLCLCTSSPLVWA
jgi:hypothetical protein